LRKDLKTSKEWKQKEIETREFRRRLSEIFGKQIELDDISALYHFVSFEELHNRRTPAGWTDELKNQLRALRTWVLQQKFKTREMGRLGAGNLLREVNFSPSSKAEFLKCHFIFNLVVEQKAYQKNVGNARVTCKDELVDSLRKTTKIYFV
jgi:hypothetical protein